MSWTTPRTWVASEHVETSFMNIHVSDNFDVLGGHVTPAGLPKTVLKSYAWGSAVAGSNANSGSGETHLSMDVTVPANYCRQGGDNIEFYGTLTIFAAHAVTFKFRLTPAGDGGTQATLMTTSAATQIIPVWWRVEYRTSTTAGLHCRYWYGASHAGAPSAGYSSASLSSLDWTAAQTAKLYLTGTASSDGAMTDYDAYGNRPKYGDGAVV